jgi:hypothetical protein
MYFIDKQHKDNFLTFIYKNSHKIDDKQYLVNYYVAAVQEIFELIDLSDSENVGNPLYSLIEWDEKKEHHIPSSPGLTGTTTMILEIGLSLFNGHKCDLDYTFGEEFSQVVIQACKIRYGLTIPQSEGMVN